MVSVACTKSDDGPIYSKIGLSSANMVWYGEGCELKHVVIGMTVFWFEFRTHYVEREVI